MKLNLTEEQKHEQYIVGSMIALHEPLSFKAMKDLYIRNAGDNFLVNKNHQPVTSQDATRMMNYLVNH